MTTNEKLVSELIKNAPKMEKAVLDKLLMLIDDLDTKGGVFTNATLSNTELLQMQDAIRQALKTSGYAKESEIFLQDLGKITINSNIVLNDEGYRFPEVALTDLEKKWQTLTSESLLNSGIRNEFEMPILKILNENISYGNSISEAKKTLQEFIAGGGDKTGKLQSYLTVTARDSIGQLQGQQLQAVAIANGYDGISYTGGLLTDSRGQCYRWIKELKGFIPKEQLQAEIDLAVKYGKEKKIVDGHKYGGMMPNTTVDNFFLKRGGFGCIHTASPKRKKPKEKTQTVQKEATEQNVIKSNFIPAKNVQEAKQRISDFGVKKIDIDRFSPPQFNKVLEALENVPKKNLPTVITDKKGYEEFTGQKIKRKEKEWMGMVLEAEFYNKADKKYSFEKVYVINAKGFKTPQEMSAHKIAYNERYSKIKGNKWYFNEFDGSTHYHELGHLYDRNKSLSTKTEWIQLTDKWHKESGVDMIKKGNGDFSGVNGSEAFAEAYASYFGNKSDGLPKYIIDYFDENIK